MKQTKRLLSLLLALCLIVGMFPVTVHAASNSCGENVTWSLNKKSGTLTISGTGPMEEQEWDEYPWANEEVHAIVIEDGITEISPNAFYQQQELTSVTIADSVKVIGDCAFQNCTDLPAVKLPNGLTTIGNEAFDSCSDLTEKIGRAHV